jgi:hypothetical protein
MATPEFIETESDWVNSQNSAVMLGFIRGRGAVLTPRKLRLLAVASCRRIWPLLSDPLNRKAVEVAEGFADGVVGLEELGAVKDLLNVEGVWVDTLTAEATMAVGWACRYPFEERDAFGCFWHATMAAYYHDLAAGTFPAGTVYHDHVTAGCHHASVREQSNAVRDLFGNPFKPVLFEHSWRTKAVVAVARGIYEERAFERLPGLADALEDAGCIDEAVLAHCRGGGHHVRGCWLIDEVLQKR